MRARGFSVSGGPASPDPAPAEASEDEEEDEEVYFHYVERAPEEEEPAAQRQPEPRPPPPRRAPPPPQRSPWRQPQLRQFEVPGWLQTGLARLQQALRKPAPEAEEDVGELLLSLLRDAVSEGRVSCGKRAKRPNPPPPAAEAGGDRLSALPPQLKARLAVAFLEPRSLAALCCTSRAWAAAGRGESSLWRAKLSALEAAWPAAALDVRTLEFHGLLGSAASWSRRYAVAHAVANKLSVACSPGVEVPGSHGFRGRLFGEGEAAQRGSVRREEERPEKFGWDTLPGSRLGSAFPSVALCRGPARVRRADAACATPTLESLATPMFSGDGGQRLPRGGPPAEARISLRSQPFSVTGSMALMPGAYLLRWRVRSAPGVAGRPPLRARASASAASADAHGGRAQALASASATSAAGLSAATLAVVATGGLAGPFVVGAAVGAGVLASGSAAAALASSLLPRLGKRPLLYPASSALLEWAESGDAPPAAVASALASAAAAAAAAGGLGGGAGRAVVEGMWRLDVEDVAGWRYVNVALAVLPSPATLRASLEEPAEARAEGLAVRGLAIDCLEAVALHHEALRNWDAAGDAVDVEEPALVQF